MVPVWSKNSAGEIRRENLGILYLSCQFGWPVSFNTQAGEYSRVNLQIVVVHSTAEFFDPTVCIFDRSTYLRSFTNETNEHRYAYAAQYQADYARLAKTGEKDPRKLRAAEPVTRRGYQRRLWIVAVYTIRQTQPA